MHLTESILVCNDLHLHTVSPDNHRDPNCPREAAVAVTVMLIAVCSAGVVPGPGPGSSLSSEPSRLRYTL